MWTTVLVITLYSSVWCIHGHIQWFMPHNLLFPKVASPSQCASLWRDVRHARVRWLCWQIFRTFQTWNRLWREAERVAKFIQNVTNIFIFHLTQSFRPATSSGHLQSCGPRISRDAYVKSNTHRRRRPQIWGACLGSLRHDGYFGIIRNVLNCHWKRYGELGRLIKRYYLRDKFRAKVIIKILKIPAESSTSANPWRQ